MSSKTPHSYAAGRATQKGGVLCVLAVYLSRCRCRNTVFAVAVLCDLCVLCGKRRCRCLTGHLFMSHTVKRAKGPQRAWFSSESCFPVGISIVRTEPQQIHSLYQSSRNNLLYRHPSRVYHHSRVFSVQLIMFLKKIML